MAVSIRLRRMGRKKQPHYRVVVADRLSPRDGRFIETIGYYKPLTHPARLVLDLERVDYWLEVGAKPSDTVRGLIKRARRGGRPEGRGGRAGPGSREGGAGRGSRQQAPGRSGRGRGGRRGGAGPRGLRSASRGGRAAGGGAGAPSAGR